jgi:photosystem II stability/assembly factor-like uncharacterized protein
MVAGCGSDPRERERLSSSAAPVTGAAVLASGLVVTSDDGRSFRRASFPGPADRTQATVAVTSPGHLLALVSGRIWRSPDSGSSWVDQDVDGRVLELAGRDGGAWAIVRRCGSSQTCRLSLLSSFDEGRHWTAVTPPVGSSIDYGSTLGVLWLSFASGRFGVATMSGGTLAVTSDGGRTWSYRRSPCRNDQSVAAAGPRLGLWIGCAGQPGAGSQGKALFRSNDGGRSFARVGPATPIDDNTQSTGLPAVGYLESLVVTDQRSAYATLERAGLAYTHDGGLHWTMAPGLAQGDMTGYRAPIAIDRQTAWEPIYQDGIHRTTDAGRHWQRAPIQPQ